MSFCFLLFFFFFFHLIRHSPSGPQNTRFASSPPEKLWRSSATWFYLLFLTQKRSFSNYFYLEQIYGLWNSVRNWKEWATIFFPEPVDCFSLRPIWPFYASLWPILFCFLNNRKKNESEKKHWKELNFGAYILILFLVFYRFYCVK